MSQDDWNNPNRRPQGPGGPPSGMDGLPGPGQGWDDLEPPKPIHQVRDEEWGTPNQPQAPRGYDGSHQGPQGAPRGGPQGGPYAPAGVQVGTGGRRPGSHDPGPEPWQPDPYGPPAGGPMMRHPGYGLQPSNYQLDGTDIGAIIISGFLPGVGHMMLGQTVKGVVILAVTFLTCGMGYIVAVLICIDAYMVAKARKVRPVGEWEFLPNP